jgi:hypothetical protein
MGLIAFSAWLGFYLLGLPSNYFTEWDLDKQILLSLLTAFAVVPSVGGVALVLMGGDYVRTSCWFAFYASVPLFIYDFVLEGLIGGEGLGFLVSHWYLTIAYLYVWIVLPVIGRALAELRRGVSRDVQGQAVRGKPKAAVTNRL